MLFYFPTFQFTGTLYSKDHRRYGKLHSNCSTAANTGMVYNADEIVNSGTVDSSITEQSSHSQKGKKYIHYWGKWF
jgi:hypothetical protein